MEVLRPLGSCQFVFTLNEVTHFHHLDDITDIVLDLSILHSTAYVLENLSNFRRHRLGIKHHETCVIHLVFHIPPLSIVDLKLPYIRGGFVLSINRYTDFVFLLVNRNAALITYAFPDPKFYSDVPLNYVVLEWHRRRSVAFMLQLTLTMMCPSGERICLKPLSLELLSMAKARSNNGYHYMVKAFQNRRQNLAGSSVCALMPSLEVGNKVILEGSWSYFSSFLHLPFRDTFQQPTAATVKPLLHLSERYNFTFFGSQKYWNNFHDSRITGQISAVAIGISNSDSDIYNATALEFLTTVRYMLVYSTDLSRTNPSTLQSLRNPFSFSVWSILMGLAGLVATMFYFKVGSCGWNDAVLLTFVPFFCQAVELTATRNLKFWFTAWTLIALLVISPYLAVIQSSVTVPGWNSGRKTLHELINENYEFYARRRTMQVVNGIIALSKIQHNNFNYRAVFDDTKGLKNLKAISNRTRLLGGHNITQRIQFIQLKTSVLVGQDTHLKIFQRMAKICADRSYKVSIPNDDLANFRIYWSFNDMRNGDVLLKYFGILTSSGIVRYWRKTAFLALGRLQVNGFREEMKTVKEGREILRRKGYYSKLNPELFSFKMTDSLMMESLYVYHYGLGLALVTITGEYIAFWLGNAVLNVKNALVLWTLLAIP